MSHDHNIHCVGLTKRELERECAWLMRQMPADPVALAKLFAQVICTLIDKNNAAIAKHLAAGDDHKPMGTY
jgi:hypothetical protein